jgi:hypothetical protein
VILNAVALATAALEAAPISVRAVNTAKFLSPLPPGQQFTIQLTKVDQGRVHFVCKEPRNLIAAGEIEYCLRS